MAFFLIRRWSFSISRHQKGLCGKRLLACMVPVSPTRTGQFSHFSHRGWTIHVNGILSKSRCVTLRKTVGKASLDQVSSCSFSCFYPVPSRSTFWILLTQGETGGVCTLPWKKEKLEAAVRWGQLAPTSKTESSQHGNLSLSLLFFSRVG